MIRFFPDLLHGLLQFILIILPVHELTSIFQILHAKGQKAIDTALKADLVVLNTAVAGKWLDAVLKDNVPRVLPKILWWIHEMRGHYFTLEYVKHLPFVAAAMIDSHTTAEYWKNRTKERLGYLSLLLINSSLSSIEACFSYSLRSFIGGICNAGPMRVILTFCTPLSMIFLHETKKSY